MRQLRQNQILEKKVHKLWQILEKKLRKSQQNTNFEEESA